MKQNNKCPFTLPHQIECEKVPATGAPEDTFIYNKALDEEEARKALHGSNDTYIALQDDRSVS